MTVNWSQLNKKAKILVVAAISAAASMQIPQVRDAVLPHLVGHPKIAAAFTSLIFIVGVIQNPVTQKILHQIGFEEETQQPDGSKKLTTGTITDTIEQPNPPQAP